MRVFAEKIGSIIARNSGKITIFGAIIRMHALTGAGMLKYQRKTRKQRLGMSGTLLGTVRTIERDIKYLRENGFIAKEGKHNDGVWKVLK